VTQDIDNEERWHGFMMAAQDGDCAAYNTLLREVTPFLHALALRQIRSRSWAEDIVQDVLLTVHRVRHTYDPKRPFKPWLAAIAYRRGVDLLRRRGRTEAYETSDERAYETFAEPAANRPTEHVLARGLSGAVAALPAQQREAVELLRLRELSLAEASKASNRSSGALKVSLHRAINTLRLQLVKI
jgi:RNA polymerase sigma-70 factor (ECF subfamily)